MAKNKIERIDQEIEKTREKIAEYQEKPVSYTHLDVYKRQGGLARITARPIRHSS